MNKNNTKNIQSQAHPTNDKYKFGRLHNHYMRETFDRLQENGQSKSEKEDTIEKGTFIAV